MRMAAFEIHMLGRDAVKDDYPAQVITQSAVWFQQASQDDCHALLAAIMAGLPGAFDRYDLADLRGALSAYRGIDRDALRANFKRFLDEVVPAQKTSA